MGPNVGRKVSRKRRGGASSSSTIKKKKKIIIITDFKKEEEEEEKKWTMKKNGNDDVALFLGESLFLPLLFLPSSFFFQKTSSSVSPSRSTTNCIWCHYGSSCNALWSKHIIEQSSCVARKL